MNKKNIQNYVMITFQNISQYILNILNNVIYQQQQHQQNQKSYIVQYFMATSYIQESTDSSKSSRLYSSKLKQLRDSIAMSKTKTKTQAKSQLPPLLYNSQNPTKKQQKLLSYSNRHLRYLFHQFCKQSYIGGAHATFDQIAQSAEFMTLNKWMVFCKQFQLTSKLTNKQAVDIYKTATNQRSQMNIFDFCKAVEIAQTKSKIDQNSFAKEILRVDSHSNARKRLCVMKVNFSGPKENFFQLSKMTQKQRYEQKKEVTQRKQKQRQYVLHQGMFKEHIEYQLFQRKSQRAERMENIRNKSAVYNPNFPQSQEQLQSSRLKQKIKKQPLIRVTPSHRTKTKSVFENYSKIFQTKRSMKNPENQIIVNQSKVKNISKTKGNQQQQTQSKSRLIFEQKKYNNQNDILREPMEQQAQQIAQVASQVAKFAQKWKIDDSDTQSDDILKSHYVNEKRIKQIKISKIDQGKENALEEVENQIDDDRETDLMITRYN